MSDLGGSLMFGLANRWLVAALLGRFMDSVGYYSPATVARTRRAARAVQRDRLGEVSVGRVSPLVLKAAADRWLADGVGTSEVRSRRDVVRSALAWAVDRDLLAGVVLHGLGVAPGCEPRVHLPVSVVRRLVAAAAEDVRRVEACGRSGPATVRALFRAEQRRVLIYLLADTGLRRGELAGLRSDDLWDRRLSVERAVKVGADGRVVVGPTKSHRHGSLTVTVTAATAGLWHDHVRAWYGAGTVAGARPVWIFPSADDRGRPVHPQTLASRLARVAATAGVKASALHAVRHTVATSLVEVGHVMGAKRRLRHGRLDTTLRHYVDTTGVDDEDVADDIERALLGTGSG